MSKIVICDIDNTVANVNQELEKRGYRTDVYPSPIPQEVLHDPDIYMEAEPIYPVIEKLKSFHANNFNIVYLTARNYLLKGITRLWLEKHKLTSREIKMTGGRPKGEFLLELFDTMSWDIREIVVIDDAPHEIKSYLSVMPDVSLYIPDWEYNRHIRDGERIKISQQRDFLKSI